MKPAAPGLKILILGGYGTFGGRLARLLADEPRLTLVIAGRSRDKAEAFCEATRDRAPMTPAVVDRNDVGPALAGLRPDVVVDATGPFQAYGPDPYRVAEACIAHGVHYLDLADGSEFVEGIARLDDAARDRGTWVLSGVSSFPVLTLAVTDELARDLDAVDEVVGGIAPSPWAGVGPNVIRAIAAYAGQPLALRRGGADRTAYALTESRDYTIAPPGRLPLRTLRFSLVDVPDLRVLPRCFPGLRDAWMGAGPVPESLHLALNALSWMVRARLLPSLTFLAPVIDLASNALRWGEHRGGMFVRVRGSRDGTSLERSWHLVAEGDDGPLIPSMAAEAVIRAALDGNPPDAGARPGSGELTLADYDRLFRGRAIETGVRRSEDEGPGSRLYRSLLGPAFDALPEAVRAVHEAPAGAVYRGEACVRRGTGLRANLAARLAGFPTEARRVPVTVTFGHDARGEAWSRDYAGKVMTSTLHEGSGRCSRLIVEKVGPIRVGMALVVEGGRLRLVVRRWSFLGMPLPLYLAPQGTMFEEERDGRYRFHVEVDSPLTGFIASYGGWLVPASAAAEDGDARPADATA